MKSRKKLCIGILIMDDADFFGGGTGLWHYFLARFASASDVLKLLPIDAVNGSLPTESELKDYDGFIMTGSNYSVNDDFPWIERAIEFIRLIYRLNTHRMYAMCYGHQLVAKALGGTVGANTCGELVFATQTTYIGEKLRSKEFYKRVFGDRKEIWLYEAHGENVLTLPTRKSVAEIMKKYLPPPSEISDSKADILSCISPPVSEVVEPVRRRRERKKAAVTTEDPAKEKEVMNIALRPKESSPEPQDDFSLQSVAAAVAEVDQKPRTGRTRRLSLMNLPVVQKMTNSSESAEPQDDFSFQNVEAELATVEQKPRNGRTRRLSLMNLPVVEKMTKSSKSSEPQDDFSFQNVEAEIAKVEQKPRNGRTRRLSLMNLPAVERMTKSSNSAEPQDDFSFQNVEAELANVEQKPKNGRTRRLSLMNLPVVEKNMAESLGTSAPQNPPCSQETSDSQKASKINSLNLKNSPKSESRSTTLSAKLSNFRLFRFFGFCFMFLYSMLFRFVSFLLGRDLLAPRSISEASKSAEASNSQALSDIHEKSVTDDEEAACDVVAWSDTCKYEILVYSDKLITSQGHPEIEMSLMTDILVPMLEDHGVLPKETIQKCVATFTDVDCEDTIKFMVSFLQG